MKKVRAIFLFFYFCMFKLQFISARSCNTTAYCGCMVQRRQDNMRAWHITRMSPMNQPSRSLWHSLRRHRKKGESCIHFVLSHKQHLLVVGYSNHTPRMEPEHHCWQWSPSASWSSAWLCCAMSNTQRTAWSVLQRLQQPLICQKKCVPLDLWNLE